MMMVMLSGSRTIDTLKGVDFGHLPISHRMSDKVASTDLPLVERVVLVRFAESLLRRLGDLLAFARLSPSGFISQSRFGSCMGSTLLRLVVFASLLRLPGLALWRSIASASGLGSTGSTLGATAIFGTLVRRELIEWLFGVTLGTSLHVVTSSGIIT